jgi:hypothetical protein
MNLDTLIEFINRNWGLGIGDWGLGIGPNPQSPIPNPQSPTILASNYSKWKNNGLNVEIIFVSSDSDLKSFEEYYAEMPWLAINKKNNDEAIEYLNDVYQISGIPALIVLDNLGNVLDMEGRNTVMKDGEKAVEKWYSNIK